LKTIRYLVLVSVLSATALVAQSYTFEAASVKPARPDNPPGQGVSRAPGGRFTAVNAPLRFLIMCAYQLQGHQLVGAPDWIANERFDIVAKMEGDPPPIVTGGPDPFRLATQALLADRFGLVAHRETRELDVYALTMARPGGKPGPALKPSPQDCAAMAAAAKAAPPAPGADGAPPSSADRVFDRAASGLADIRFHCSRMACRIRSGARCSIAPVCLATGRSSWRSRR
jgi:uncharacterized protein (TIGR03435 family)